MGEHVEARTEFPIGAGREGERSLSEPIRLIQEREAGNKVQCPLLPHNVLFPSQEAWRPMFPDE